MLLDCGLAAARLLLSAAGLLLGCGWEHWLAAWCV